MTNLKPDRDLMAREVIEGLSKAVKELPCKYLYDERGSILFDKITRVKDYYPTRTEREIIHSNIGEITESMGENALLIYYGSGNSEKARVILDHLPSPTAYVPIDISGDHLMKSVAALSEDYPGLEILPVCADYTQPLEIPKPYKSPAWPVVYYPGSTIGNFNPIDAVEFLGKIADVIGEEGGLYLGVDLVKDPEILHAAYNDSEGLTAEFNLNMLSHLNRELKTDFNIGEFRHKTFFNAQEGRIECIWSVKPTRRSISMKPRLKSKRANPSGPSPPINTLSKVSVPSPGRPGSKFVMSGPTPKTGSASCTSPSCLLNLPMGIP